MHVDRRTFLKGTAAVGGAVGLGLFDLSEARAEMRELKISRTTETRSTCPYCSVSCGVIIHTLGDKAKNVKPARWSTSRATLTIRSIGERSVPRASRSRTTSSIPDRLTTPKVRRPGSDKWEEISWDAAIAGIARHIKEHPRQDLRRHQRQGRDGEPHPGHRDDRGLHRHQRVQLPAVEVRRRASESRTETRKHEYDTAQRWPVWPPRSVAVR